MDFDEDEFDLTPLIAHNANYDLSLMDSPSPEPELLEATSTIQPRPISKRRGKKRSSRACASCRARKVRCNIVAHGAPCSNCRHDEVDCVLPLSRRQRAAKERAEQQQKEQQFHNDPNPINSSENGDCCASNHGYHDIEIDYIQEEAEDRSREELVPPHGMTISEHPLCEILPAHSASQQASPVLGPTLLPAIPRFYGRTGIEAPLATAPLPISSRLPRIFAALPTHITQTDVSYLTTRSAFTLPSQNLQVALLQAYVEYVHPVLPVLDLDEFLESVNTGEGKQISLILFQSVILSAIDCVSERLVRAECDGRSKSEFTREMIERVKLLYDFDTTTDRLTIIQSLLLLSYTLSQNASAQNNTHKNAHHYFGLALSLSFSLGLHRSTSPPPAGPGAFAIAILTPQLSALRLKRLERRIWWTLFLQDKLLEINGKGRSRLSPSDFSVSPPIPSDFDLDLFPDSIHERRTAMSFIDRVKLCTWTNFQHHQQQNLIHHSQERRSHAHSLFISPQQIDLEEEHDLETNTYPSLSPQSYTSTSPSDEADCLTPPPLPQPMSQHPEPHSFTLVLSKENVVTPERDLKISNGEGGRDEEEIDAGYGVEGEYDDYMEFLRV